MSDTPIPNNWPQLYREALLESDPLKVPVRIEEAHKAIHRRALELWYAGSPRTPRTKEQRDLDAALHFLGLLREVGPMERTF
jgi:hypothetical protein